MTDIKRIIFIASYPPRKCGIATFTHDLVRATQKLLPHIQISVCAMNETSDVERNYPPEVKYSIDQTNPKSYLKIAKKINKYADQTIVIIQHEYGIFNGSESPYLNNFIDQLKCPIITTLHTVLDKPNPIIYKNTKDLIQKSTQVIALTNSSVKLLKKLYPTETTKFKLVLHGIHPLLFTESKILKEKLDIKSKHVLLTFGLLSRNKGIEHIIKSIPKIKTKFPDVLYLIVGATHPEVAKNEGESYRKELKKLVDELSVKDNVQFISGYQSLKSILEYLQTTDIYVSTSTDPNQTVSGTLSYALGAGRTVISTNFSQAKEIISKDVGRLVPIGDSNSIANAALELFSNPEGIKKMNYHAYQKTRSMLWTNVANNYLDSIVEIADKGNTSFERWPKLNWEHLNEMSKLSGILQFSKLKIPDRSSGYTLDDNSRALQLIIIARQINFISDSAFKKLYKKYLNIIEKCLTHQPIINYLSAVHLPTEQNFQENISDSIARSYYALNSAKHFDPKLNSELVDKLLNNLKENINTTYDHTNATAQNIYGACLAYTDNDKSSLKIIKMLANQMVESYKLYATEDWHWFDDEMTYANGQLCGSLLEASIITKSKIYKKVGLDCLDFLIKSCFMGEIYVPIGQNGWHKKDGYRALFDQQPEDVYAMIMALESAYKLTLDKKYIDLALKAFSWYLGNNLIGARLYDYTNGGCHDGLNPLGVNKNEGAESTISYLGSRVIIERLKNSV